MILFIFLMLCGSFALTLQKAVNAALGQQIGGMESSFVNHFVGALFAGLLFLAGIHTGQIYFSGIPPTLFLGGCFGVFLVFFINTAIPIIGLMATLICLILSQLITSSVLDHYGIFSDKIVKMGPLRITGIALVILGAALVLSRKKSSTT